MIEEAYCNFKVAKLLKEKGFHVSYNPHIRYSPDGTVNYWEEEKGDIYSPTQQSALRWMRETHKKYIDIYLSDDDSGSFLYVIQTLFSCVPLYTCDKHFKSYEETVDAALEYCLEKLI